MHYSKLNSTIHFPFFNISSPSLVNLSLVYICTCLELYSIPPSHQFSHPTRKLKLCRQNKWSSRSRSRSISCQVKHPKTSIADVQQFRHYLHSQRGRGGRERGGTNKVNLSWGWQKANSIICANIMQIVLGGKTLGRRKKTWHWLRFLVGIPENKKRQRARRERERGGLRGGETS